MTENIVAQLKRELRQRDLKIKELEALMVKDPLTGMFNRKGFSELAKRIFTDVRALRDERANHRKHFYVDSFAILFFDIDNFKKINDAYGHDVGDKVLKFTSSIISNKLRLSDFVGRWGGEEIVAALIGANEADAYKKAEEIRKAVKSRVKIPAYPDLQVTLSIGVAELDGSPSLDDLIKQADEAMYKAKTSGKDQVVKYSDLKAGVIGKK